MSEENKDVKLMLTREFIDSLEESIETTAKKSGGRPDNLAVRVEVILALSEDGKLVTIQQTVDFGELNTTGEDDETD